MYQYVICLTGVKIYICLVLFHFFFYIFLFLFRVGNAIKLNIVFRMFYGNITRLLCNLNSLILRTYSFRSKIKLFCYSVHNPESPSGEPPMLRPPAMPSSETASQHSRHPSGSSRVGTALSDTGSISSSGSFQSAASMQSDQSMQSIQSHSSMQSAHSQQAQQAGSTFRSSTQTCTSEIGLLLIFFKVTPMYVNVELIIFRS